MESTELERRFVSQSFKRSSCAKQCDANDGNSKQTLTPHTGRGHADTAVAHQAAARTALTLRHQHMRQLFQERNLY